VVCCIQCHFPEVFCEYDTGHQRQRVSHCHTLFLLTKFTSIWKYVVAKQMPSNSITSSTCMVSILGKKDLY
jgi:hypothetical protein